MKFPVRSADAHTAKNKKSNKMTIGLSSCGIAAGAKDVFSALEKEIAARGLDVALAQTGCVGMCFVEPLVEVSSAGGPPVLYGNVNPSVALEILQHHIVEADPSHEALKKYIMAVSPKQGSCCGTAG